MLNSDEFDDIDELLSGKYISLGPNEKKTLKFFGPTERKIEEVEKKWNNEPVTKIRFVVTDPNNDMEKWFDVGKRSSNLCSHCTNSNWRAISKATIGKSITL